MLKKMSTPPCASCSGSCFPPWRRGGRPSSGAEASVARTSPGASPATSLLSREEEEVASRCSLLFDLCRKGDPATPLLEAERAPPCCGVPMRRTLLHSTFSSAPVRHRSRPRGRRHGPAPRSVIACLLATNSRWRRSSLPQPSFNPCSLSPLPTTTTGRPCSSMRRASSGDAQRGGELCDYQWRMSP